MHARCNRVCVTPKLSPRACQVTSPANERGSSPLLPWLQARYAELEERWRLVNGTL